MRVLVTCLLCILCSMSFAEGEEKALQAEAEFGAVLTSGNTDSSALLAKLDAKHNSASWINHYVLEGFYKEDQTIFTDADGNETKNSQTTAEKYFASMQNDYKLNEEYRGLFMFTSYEVDKFSGYDYQATIAAGYSDRLFKNANHSLTYSFGPGMAFSKDEDTENDNGDVIEGEKNENLVLRISADYKWKISDTANFSQTLSSEVSTDSDKNTKTKAVTALTSKINSSFSMKASYTVQHNSVVQPGFEGTDTQTSLSLVYTY